ncbi:Starch synthase 3 [Hibiscus syriacus]|uniref:starch synthase n=1 Tax=Hibiscus syriacus TaxID=106335 RepID=A0A6A2X3N7_HIBSY|nr:Starch synthase 3 [Hibiscus syriacus]
MEVSLQLQRPLRYQSLLNHRTDCFQINSLPFARTVLFTPWRRECLAGRVPHKVTVNAADFSKRRQRKLSSGSSPKGFTPKTQAGTSDKKRDQKNNDEEEDSSIPTSRVSEKPNKTEIESKVDEELTIGYVTSTGKELAVAESNLNAESGRVSKFVEGVAGLQKKEVILENDTVSTSRDITSEGTQLYGTITDDTFIEGKHFDGTIIDDTAAEGKHLDGAIADDTVTGGVYLDGKKTDDNDILKDESVEPDEKTVEDLSAKMKLEMEENLRKQEIEGLADENFLKGNKIFVYPQIVRPDEEIEVFFNRREEKGTRETCKEQEEKRKQEEEQRRIEVEKAANEEDRAQAKAAVQKRREILERLMKNAVRYVDNIWFIEPNDFKGADKVKLYYNKTSGALAHANELWIHGGHNNWSDGLTIVEKLFRSEREGGDWWYAEVVIPDRALVLDWVFANGPPKVATIYDNNNRQDFHAIVPKNIPEELFWVEEEHQIFRKLQAERKLREEAICAKAEKTARLKAEMKERTLKRFLLSQKHIVYTEPLDVHAGSTIIVFYNPANTVLNGRQEVWFRCSFNRWTHRMGPLPPKRMLPAENSSHLKAIVKVPLDAYMMDFVFSEREDGGSFDNKEGMDYHIPVLGGIVKEPPMHIVHIAVEMAPIAKVGGLGDVVTSLSRAVQDLNHNVNIILPKYDCLKLSHVKDLHYQRSYSWGGTEVKVWFGKVEGLSVYFLEPQNGIVWKGCVYGCNNDAERFGFFCHSALEFLHQGGLQPDIIHCHDWSSAPVAWLFKDQYMHYGLSKTRVVFTIHNLEFGAHFIGKAMQYADKATTVSHTYAKEVAGNPAVAPNLHKFHGILNGIDLDIWDPYNDKFLPIPYTSENVVEGKRAAKEALQQRLGLKKSDLPVVGIISRLTHQKGIHLIKHAILRTLERNGQPEFHGSDIDVILHRTFLGHPFSCILEMNVVLLGSAPDPRIQNDFVNLANQLHSSHWDRARLVLTYDEPLSHLIYAGADFVLVPSIFEPCGLTQLTAMRYGSIPVVRKTGGLYDTVFDVDHDKARAEAQGLEPNGFNFDGADSGGVDYALNRAISAWYDGRDWFYSLCKRVMEQDWSWNRPALDYMELYHAAKKY